MRVEAVLLLMVTGLACGTPAQVGPGFSVQPASSTFWNLSTNPVLMPWYNGTNSAIIGVGAIPMPGSSTGEYLVGLTLRNPQGGAGLADLLIARYTPAPPGSTAPPVLVPLPNDTVALNTVAGDRSIQFSPDGLTAVFERIYLAPPVIFQSVYITQRSSITAPFPAPTQVIGVHGLGSAADPAIGSIAGQLVLIYFGVNPDANGVPRQGIWMDDLFPPSGSVPFWFAGGSPQLVAVPVNAGWDVHSPTPILGADGDLEGLWLAEVDTATSDSDMYFADDLDPSTPSILLFDTGGWLNNGALVGGQFLCADDTNSGVDLRESWGAWLVGDVETIGNGATVDATVGAPPGGIAVVMASVNYGVPTPAPPGVFGQVGLGAGFAPLGGLTVVGADGIAAVSFTTPTSPSLAGTWPIQAAVAHNGSVVLSNTSRIRLE